ncbi:hypothetical protein BHM03_00013346 [Ensete ventricosum]|nr:hypothetical protein BHM03_00013346 [Ensete ventricosum]
MCSSSPPLPSSSFRPSLVVCLFSRLLSSNQLTLRTMGSLPEEEEYASDLQSDRCGSYSPSADVSESESSGGLSDRAPLAAASDPFASSPLAALLPADPHLVLWEPKLEKRETDFSGLYCLCPRLHPFRSLDRDRLAT